MLKNKKKLLTIIGIVCAVVIVALTCVFTMVPGGKSYFEYRFLTSNYQEQYKALSSLNALDSQKQANKAFKKRMKSLYSEKKYMQVINMVRNDSRYVTSDIVATIPERLKAVSFGEYRAAAESLLKSGVKANKNYVDNSKVSDHHAIIPTEEKGSLANLSKEEKHI